MLVILGTLRYQIAIFRVSAMVLRMVTETVFVNVAGVVLTVKTDAIPDVYAAHRTTRTFAPHAQATA